MHACNYAHAIELSKKSSLNMKFKREVDMLKMASLRAMTLAFA
jgi:hypothetical protein